MYPKSASTILSVRAADMVKQLYEWFFLKKNGIKKKQKNISSELLESFAQQITETEDISRNDTPSIPFS